MTRTRDVVPGDSAERLSTSGEASAKPLPTDVRRDETPDAGLDFDQRCDVLRDVVLRQPMHREIFLSILAFCDESRPEPDVEAHVQAQPQFAYETQSPYYLIRALVDAGGLQRFELDEQGEVVTPERTQGLTEDEIDDLVWSISYQTSAEGMTVLSDEAPQARLRRLVERRPLRARTYLSVLEYCTRPRTRAELEGFLRGNPILEEEAVHGEPLKPSVFMDKLESAGMLVWDGRWNTSDAGRAYLERGANASAD